MKTFVNPDTFQKLARFGVQSTGNIVTAGVVVFLVAMWALTSPLVWLSDRMAGHGKVKTKTNEQLKKEKL